MPNFFDDAVSGGNYNYLFQEITEHPKKQNMLKMDYTPTSSDRITFRGRTWWADRRGYEGLAAFNSNWDQLYHHYLFTEDSVMAVVHPRVLADDRQRVQHQLPGARRDRRGDLGRQLRSGHP